MNEDEIYLKYYNGADIKQLNYVISRHETFRFAADATGRERVVAATAPAAAIFPPPRAPRRAR